MLSVIICTYNRADILELCLQSFLKQVGTYTFEVIIVDNNSTDNTAAISKKYVDEYDFFRYEFEEVIGLSAARNKGIRVASYEWIAYCDDDAIAHQDFVEQAITTFERYDFDAFGGRFLPFYKTTKPNWLPKDFGSNGIARADIGDMPKGHYICGGVMAFKKKALAVVGNFPTNIGMKGNEIGYGEDNWMQDQFFEKKLTVGYNPFWIIDHLVADRKLKLSWHLQSQFHKGRTFFFLANDQWRQQINFFWMLKHSLIEIGKFSKTYLTQKQESYHPKNIALTILTPQAKLLGYYNAKQQARKKK